MPATPIPTPARLAEAADHFHLRLVVLFGSRAHGRPPPGPGSDVDIAVLGCPGERFLACHTALAEAWPDHSLDLVRLEDADPLSRHEIMSQGVLLWGDPDLFCDYRAYAYRDFTDSADLRALEQRLFERKMDWIREQLHDSA